MQTTPDFTWLFIKMVAGLVLVMGLAVVLFRVVIPKTRLAKLRHGTSWATVLAGIRVDQNRSLYLVKIMKRYFVLGAGEGALNLITELSATEGDEIAQKQ